MNKRTTVLTLLVLSIVMMGALYMPPVTPRTTVDTVEDAAFPGARPVEALSGYDSPNITVTLDSPTNRSAVAGVFNMTLDVASDFGPLNFTLFIDGDVYPDYNNTVIATGKQNVTVDVSGYPDHVANFTCYFEHNATERESVYYEFEIDNIHDPIKVRLISPANGSVVSGVFDLVVNITSDYGPLNLTVYIDGRVYPDYNETLVGNGTQTFPINTTTLHEGLLDFELFFAYNTTANYTYFLRFIVDNDGYSISAEFLTPAPGSTLVGTVALQVDVASDYGPLNFTLLIDNEVYPDYDGVLIGTGRQYIVVVTTALREGLLNFTFWFWYNSSGTFDQRVYSVNYTVDNIPGSVRAFLIGPTPGSTVSGDLTITVDIGSDFGFVYTTLYVDGEVRYTQYDHAWTGTGVKNFTLDTTVLPDGPRNFTFVFEYNATNRDVLQTTFNIDNHGPPEVKILSPEDDALFTGLDSILVNISSDYDQVHLNVTVDGVTTPEYNMTTVAPGVVTISVNGSRYENGHHNITVIVWTVEGLTASDTRRFVFKDHVRFAVADLTDYSVVSGVMTVRVKVFTPHDRVTFSVYVDGVLSEDARFLTLAPGVNTVHINTTGLSEGDHTFLFVAYDFYGHTWTEVLTLTVDNHGPPSVRIVGPRTDIVVGTVTFTVDVETTWDNVTMSVYVDDDEVPGLVDIVVVPGENEFTIDVGAYSKWQHVVKVVVVTPEGESAEYERTFGFATVRIEEVASLVLLVALAVFIPLVRRRRGVPLRPVLLVDLIFMLVAVGLFVIIGVNSLATAVWHFNLASIWALGGLLVFANWVAPLVVGESSE